MPSVTLKRRSGFTLVELIVVLLVMGILAAAAVGRFAGRSEFDASAYTNQVKSILRFAQKAAILQRRDIFVVSDGNRFAACYDAACNNVLTAPGGANSGTSPAKKYCLISGTYRADWLCEGRPDAVTLSGNFNGNSITFRGLNGAPSVNGVRLSAPHTLTLTAKVALQITIEPVTGYVH